MKGKTPFLKRWPGGWRCGKGRSIFRRRARGLCGCSSCPLGWARQANRPGGKIAPQRAREAPEKQESMPDQPKTPAAARNRLSAGPNAHHLVSPVKDRGYSPGLRWLFLTLPWMRVTLWGLSSGLCIPEERVEGMTKSGAVPRRYQASFMISSPQYATWRQSVG